MLTLTLEALRLQNRPAGWSALIAWFKKQKLDCEIYGALKP